MDGCGIQPELYNLPPACRLRGVMETVTEKFMRLQIEKTTSVLIESTDADGYSTGYSENYTPVRVYTGGGFEGKILDAVITGVENGRCEATSSTISRPHP